MAGNGGYPASWGNYIGVKGYINCCELHELLEIMRIIFFYPDQNENILRLYDIRVVAVNKDA